MHNIWSKVSSNYFAWADYDIFLGKTWKLRKVLYHLEIVLFHLVCLFFSLEI